MRQFIRDMKRVYRISRECGDSRRYSLYNAFEDARWCASCRRALPLWGARKYDIEYAEVTYDRHHLGYYG